MAIGAAALSCVAAQDPFPNQPGVLSAAEIDDAKKAMLAVSGKESFALVASGRRGAAHMLLGYAVFAAPPRDFSGRVKFRRQVVCNFMGVMDRWQCGSPHDEFRMTANGIDHVFSYQVIQGAGDRQAAVDVANFMYSRCWGTRLAAIGVKPFTPSPSADFVNTVLDDGKRLKVMTGPLGDGHSYSLEKTDRKADNCGFRIVSVQMAKPGAAQPSSGKSEAPQQVTVAPQQAAGDPKSQPAGKPVQLELTESAAKERARVAKEREDELARKGAAEQLQRDAEMRKQNYWTLGSWSINKVEVANAVLGLSVVAGVLALVVPWFQLIAVGRRAAASVAVGFAAACTLLGFASALHEGHYLLIFAIPMVLAWVAAIGFSVWAGAEGATAGASAKTGSALEWMLWFVGISVVAVVVGQLTGSWVGMVEMLGLLLLVAIPIVAARSASRYALAHSANVRLRGILATWGLCIALGIGAGISVDVLTGGGFMIPATIAYPMVQFVVGAVAGLIVGIYCDRQVRARQRSALPWQMPPGR